MPRTLPSAVVPALALWLLGAGASVGAAGCAIGSQRFGRVIDSSLITQVKVGTSTKQDVLDLFGPPTNFKRQGGGLGALLEGRGPGKVRQPDALVDVPRGAEDVFTYEYREENESFFTALLFTYFSRDTIADTLMVFFDAKDVVKYLAFAKQTDAEVESEDAAE